MISIGSWLNSIGYDMDLNDGLWMEAYIEEHKFRDLCELLFDFNAYCCKNDCGIDFWGKKHGQ